MKVRLGASSNSDTVKALMAQQFCVVYGREEDDGTIYLTLKPNKGKCS